MSEIKKKKLSELFKEIEARAAAKGHTLAVVLFSSDREHLDAEPFVVALTDSGSEAEGLRAQLVDVARYLDSPASDDMHRRVLERRDLDAEIEGVERTLREKSDRRDDLTRSLGFLASRERDLAIRRMSESNRRVEEDAPVEASPADVTSFSEALEDYIRGVVSDDPAREQPVEVGS